MNSADQQAHSARQLLAGRRHGLLSTLSLEHPGYPFGSLAPYVLDYDGMPLLLLSHLSQHSRNVDADARCALTVMDIPHGDIQQVARLSAPGELRLLETPGEAAQRYFRYFPQTRMYFDELGFRFYRFTALRWHWNGGFATARWFGNDRILRPQPFDPSTEAGIVAHMNTDHRDVLPRYLARAGSIAPGDGELHVLGIDGEGLDLGDGSEHFRVALPRPISAAGEAREVLVEMARDDND